MSTVFPRAFEAWSARAPSYRLGGRMRHQGFLRALGASDAFASSRSVSFYTRCRSTSSISIFPTTRRVSGVLIAPIPRQSQHLIVPIRHFHSSQKHLYDIPPPPLPPVPPASRSTFRRFAIEYPQKALRWLLAQSKRGIRFIVQDICWAFLRNPLIVRQWYRSMKKSAKHFVKWIWTGMSLFTANVRVSLQLARKKAVGIPLSYREHKLLVRTTTDCFKLIPFSLFIIIPLGELLLPFALRLFPNMLPSTFFEKQYDNAYLSRKLKAKQELASFFQEIITERTKSLADASDPSIKDKAQALQAFQQKLLSYSEHERAMASSSSSAASSTKNGAPDADAKGSLSDSDKSPDSKPSKPSPPPPVPFMDVKELLQFSKLFKDNFQLDRMPLESLRVICSLLGIKPYGVRMNVVLQLRHHLLKLKREDRHILWDGVESLSHEELIEACKARCMRFYHISDDQMREQLRIWIELSSRREIPPVLLLWTRSITMTHRPLAAPVSDIPAEGTKETTAKQDDVEASTSSPTTRQTSGGFAAEEYLSSEDAPHAQERGEKGTQNESSGVAGDGDEATSRLDQAQRRLGELRMEEQEIKNTIREHNQTKNRVTASPPSPQRSEKSDDSYGTSSSSGSTTSSSVSSRKQEDLSSMLASRYPADRDTLIRRMQKMEEELRLLRQITGQQQQHVIDAAVKLAELVEGPEENEMNDAIDQSESLRDAVAANEQFTLSGGGGEADQSPASSSLSDQSRISAVHSDETNQALTTGSPAEYEEHQKLELKKILTHLETGLLNTDQQLDQAKLIEEAGGNTDAIFYPDTDVEETEPHDTTTTTKSAPSVSYSTASDLEKPKAG